MKKTDKKRDNQIRQVLAACCESELKAISGFEWLTHEVNFNRFEDSLRITCVFSDDECLTKAKERGDLKKAENLIVAALRTVKITLTKPNKQIRFDSESRCATEHSGNWAKRLKSN